MAVTGDERQVTVECESLKETPYELLFRSMSGTECLSGLFEYEVELLCASPNVPMEKVLGHDMTLSLEVPLPVKTPPARRYFNGYVSAFHFVGLEGEFALYSATLRPRMWLLTRHKDCRIFEGKSVPQVVQEILKSYGFEHDANTFLTADRGEEYKPREYCVQYNETDFAFVSRLLEEEGIHYFFEHGKKGHKLILADSIMGHTPLEGYETVPFQAVDRKTDRDVEAITSWSMHQAIEADHYALGDFDFTDPRLDKISGRAMSQAERNHAKAGHFEHYEYPSPVSKMTGYGPQMAESLARIRIQEMHAQWEYVEGTCSARGLAVGNTFGLTGHPREELSKPAFLVTSASFAIQSEDYRSKIDTSRPLTYSCTFTAINCRQTFRPQRKTAKPVIAGPQTAVVVGPSGNPIHTDKFGRVRVAFPWIRASEKEKERDTVSCWCRVSQIWAGQGWGGVQLPHVGHEVIVSFLDGDPDKPIVTGRVFNGRNPHWQKLPDHATRSYIMDQVGNRIVMQSKEEEKGISIHTPSLDTHLWMGHQDGLELPDDREAYVQKANENVEKAKAGLSGFVRQMESLVKVIPPRPPNKEGGMVATTDGDLVTRAKGNRFDVAEGDKIEIVEGNVHTINNKDKFEVTNGVSGALHVGAKFTGTMGAKGDVTLGASISATVGAKFDASFAASVAWSQGGKVEILKEKKYEFTKKKFTGADTEIKHQVSERPDLVRNQSAKEFFVRGFLPGFVADLYKLEPLADGKADAEMILKSREISIRCNKTVISVTKDGKVLIEAPDGNVEVKTGTTAIDSKESFELKSKTVKISGSTIDIASNLSVKG